MKSNAVVVRLLAVIMTATEALCADSFVGPWNIRTELVVVSVPLSTAMELIPRFRVTSRARSADVVWKGIEQGDFELVDRTQAWCYVSAPMLWSKVPASQPLSVPGPQESGTSENIIEARYPTEFEPPQVPQNFGGRATVSKRTPNTNGIPRVPTTFETRNTGLNLDVNCRLTSVGLISLQINAGYVTLPRFRNVVSRAVSERYVVWEQPDFYTSRVTTEMDLASGEWALLNSAAVAAESQRMLLFLLRATAIPIRR